jgi:subfamily B ATP-binding cassette protein MsbA
MPAYNRLLPYLRPHGWRMAITIVGNLAAALLDGFAIALLIPFLNILFHQPAIAMKSGWVARLLDATVGSRIIPGDEMRSLRNVIIIVLAAVVAKNILVWIAGQFGAALQEYVTRDLRNSVYRHLAHLPLGYFTQMKAGQILSRVINDTFETRLILTQIVTQSLQSASLVLVYIAILFSISWRLTLLALIILPLLGVSLQPMLKKLRKGNLRRGNQHGEMTSVLQETISGIRIVKSFGTEAYEEGRFGEGSNKYARSSVRITRLALIAPPITEIIGTSIAVLVLWIGAWQVLVTGGMTGATLLAFLTLVLRLLQPLKQLSTMRTTAQSSLASAERLFEILDSPTGSLQHRLGRPQRLGDRGGGPERRGEEHAGRPHPAILRADKRADHARRSRHARDQAARAQGAHGDRQPGDRPVQRFRPQQHRLRRREQIHRRPGRGRREGRKCAWLHHGAASGLSDAAGREGDQALRRPETAPRDCTGLAQ